MRRILVFIVAMAATQISYAQLQKGAIQLGGSIAFSSRENGNQKQNTFGINPQAGLFLTDNTSLGLRLGYDRFNNKVTGQPDIGSDTFSVGVYSRFHKSIADNFYLFLQPSINLGFGTLDVFNGGGFTEGDINTFGVAVAPGMTYFLSSKFAIELSLGALSYESGTLDVNGAETDINNFNLGVDFTNLNLGVSFYIK